MVEITNADGVIDFFFEKSALFRVIHVDGAVGSISPSQPAIHMAVFSERTPIPRQQAFAIKDGVVQSEVIERRVSKTGIFREVEADLVLSVTGAIAIRDWLTERLNEIQDVVKRSMEKQQK